MSLATKGGTIEVEIQISRFAGQNFETKNVLPFKISSLD